MVTKEEAARISAKFAAVAIGEDPELVARACLVIGIDAMMRGGLTIEAARATILLNLEKLYGQPVLSYPKPN
jgi:hypothetical protein